MIAHNAKNWSRFIQDWNSTCDNAELTAVYHFNSWDVTRRRASMLREKGYDLRERSLNDEKITFGQKLFAEQWNSDIGDNMLKMLYPKNSWIQIRQRAMRLRQLGIKMKSRKMQKKISENICDKSIDEIAPVVVKLEASVIREILHDYKKNESIMITAQLNAVSKDVVRQILKEASI